MKETLLKRRLNIPSPMNPNDLGEVVHSHRLSLGRFRYQGRVVHALKRTVISAC
jgi:hypothetical protein